MRNPAQLENLMLCKVCESATEYFGEQRFSRTFDCALSALHRCGFVFVEQPTWLEQAYELPIAAADTGIVVRNLRFADLVGTLIDLDCRRRASSSIRRRRRAVRPPHARPRLRFLPAGQVLRQHLCDGLRRGGGAAIRSGDQHRGDRAHRRAHERLAAARALAPTVLVDRASCPQCAIVPANGGTTRPKVASTSVFSRLAPCKSWLSDSGMQLSSNGRNVHVFSRERSARGWCRMVGNSADSHSPAAGSGSVVSRRRSLTHSDARPPGRPGRPPRIPSIDAIVGAMLLKAGPWRCTMPAPVCPAFPFDRPPGRRVHRTLDLKSAI